MWARIIVILIVVVILIYILLPSMKHRIDRGWKRFRQWINENDHGEKLHGFNEEDITLPDVCEVPHSDMSRLRDEICAQQTRGTSQQDGKDERDQDCFWYGGALLCP